MIAERRFPLVTLVLIAANIFAAFALFFSPDLVYQFGFLSDRPTLQGAATSLFLHANVIHLLGNMVFLAAVGAAVELATGSIRFALVYSISGLAGIALHYFITRHTPDAAPYIGASGAVAGCAAYYSFRYVGLKVAIAPKTAVPVIWVTLLWVVLQVVGAFVKLGDTGGTAYWAHLGGFAAGIVISLVFRAPDLGQIKLGHEVLERMNDRGPAAVEAAATRHLETHPNDVKALGELARAQAQLGESQAEATTILKLIELSAEAEQPALLARLVEVGHAEMLASSRRTNFAEKYKETHPDVSRALLKSVIEGSPTDSQRPEALLALVGLERESEPARAQVLLSELLRNYPLHPCVDLARKRGWVN